MTHSNLFTENHKRLYFVGPNKQVLTGLSVSLTDSETSALLANYTDARLNSDYAKTAVAVCIGAGVVSGTTATTISPKDYVTRAEVAVMVQHMLQKTGLIFF